MDKTWYPAQLGQRDSSYFNSAQRIPGLGLSADGVNDSGDAVATSRLRPEALDQRSTFRHQVEVPGLVQQVPDETTEDDSSYDTGANFQYNLIYSNSTITREAKQVDALEVTPTDGCGRMKGC